MFLTVKLFWADVRTVLRNQPNRLIGHLGGRSDKAGAIVRIVAQLGVSIAILAVCLPVIFSPTQSDKSKELAAGFVGMVVGFWLR